MGRRVAFFLRKGRESDNFNQTAGFKTFSIPSPLRAQTGLDGGLVTLLLGPSYKTWDMSYAETHQIHRRAEPRHSCLSSGTLVCK